MTDAALPIALLSLLLRLAAAAYAFYLATVFRDRRVWWFVGAGVCLLAIRQFLSFPAVSAVAPALGSIAAEHVAALVASVTILIGVVWCASIYRTTQRLRHEAEAQAGDLRGLAAQLEKANEDLKREVEDRIRAGQAVTESQERLRATFEQAAVGIAHVGLDGGFLRINDRFCQILGYSRAEMLERTLQDITFADDLATDLEHVRQLLAGETRTYSLEKRYVRKDRSLVWTNLTKSLVRKPSGEPDYFISVVEDIFERKRLEENLIRSNRELEQFAYVASHDLQEPLRMVSSYTQLLEQRYRDRLDQDAKDFIGFAVDGANRMQRLISDLLSYSRVTTRGRPLEPVDAHSALGEAVSNLAMMIDENHAIVTNDDLPTVNADHGQLVQVFQNLISNGVKFHRDEAPRVHVAAEKTGHEWLFSVRDNGLGIAPEFRERIFVIFQRLHGREDFPGTGIGLALCKRIVERHGGRIWVESAQGKGSTFYFTLSA